MSGRGYSVTALAGVPVVRPGDDLCRVVVQAVEASGMALEDGDGASGEDDTSDLTIVGKIIVDEINKWCNVRSGPGLEYTIIGKAKKNDTYNIYGAVEDWYQIDYNGSIGYLYGDLASEVLPGNV